MSPALLQPAAESLQNAMANNLHGTDTKPRKPDIEIGDHNGGLQHAAGVSGRSSPCAAPFSLQKVRAIELFYVDTKRYPPSVLLKEVKRRLAIRQEQMSPEDLAKLTNPKHWDDFSLPAEAHSEMAVLDALEHMEYLKPGGESERISEKHGGRRLTPEEVLQYLGDDEIYSC